jgi:hypothetical protein
MFASLLLAFLAHGVAHHDVFIVSLASSLFGKDGVGFGFALRGRRDSLEWSKGTNGFFVYGLRHL